MKTITLYLGLDVHKDSITLAIAEFGPKGEIRPFGTITNDLHALEKALSRIRKAHPGAGLEVAYEAGPCGFGIARRLHQVGIPCLVAAPSLIPKQPGAPFKTDKRDARNLARLLRAGELTAVYVPEPTDEAIRDLCRARIRATRARRLTPNTGSHPVKSTSVHSIQMCRACRIWAKRKTEPPRPDTLGEVSAATSKTDTWVSVGSSAWFAFRTLVPRSCLEQDAPHPRCKPHLSCRPHDSILVHLPEPYTKGLAVPLLRRLGSKPTASRRCHCAWEQ